jgi:hypothetical protein
MEKKIIIEITGLNNSARAINGNTINLEKLMQIAGLSWNSIMQNVAFEIEHELPKGVKSTSEVVAEAIENVIYVAKRWNKQNYKITL